jgi:hypothetical protein
MSDAHSPPASVAPFKVATVIVTALEALISAAALNLGEALGGNRVLAPGERDPHEAWIALLSVSTLLDTLGPLMHAETRESYQARVAGLAGLLASQYPETPFAVPTPGVSSLEGQVRAARGAADSQA